MSSASFERPCGVSGAVALERAGAWLLKNGYEIVARSAGDLHLFHRAGPATAARTDPGMHQLTLRSDGRTLTFSFDVGVTSTAPLSPEQTTELERRVEAATAAASAQPAAASVTRPEVAPRCATCGTVGGLGAQICEVCGSKL